MYIGEFDMFDTADVWPKNTTYPVKLWKPGADRSLVAVPNSDGTGQKTVMAMNVIGTFAYKYAEQRFCMITEINGTYWAVSAEC